jgi:DNA-binding CsgD family transcriptional regulator
VADAYPAGTPHVGVDLGSPEPDRALVGLLQLQAMVLANPQPLAGLRAMVDMIFTSPRTTRVSVGVPIEDQGLVRYLAHAGGPRPAHQALVITATPIAAKAMGTGELVQVMHTEGVPHNCIHVPIVGEQQVLGFFGIGLRGTEPIEPWREEAIWATSDLMALLLLEYGACRAQPTPSGSPLDSMTPRQREVLVELVERGTGNSDIARKIGLSPRTIKIHLMAAYRQLGVRTRADAVRVVLTEHGDWLEQERASRQQRPDAV